MSIGEEFKEFCGRLVIDKPRSIIIRYQTITRRLNLDYRQLDKKIGNSMLIGSYGRGTAIRGCGDIDMIYRMPELLFDRYRRQANGQSDLLHDLRKSLQQDFPDVAISADGHAVAIPPTDDLAFRIVPVFLEKSRGYIYPDSSLNGSWKLMSPTSEIEAVSEMNNRSNGNLRWLCRMMRAWKHKWRVPMNGLAIDSLAYRFMSDWRFSDKPVLYYDWMSRDFFRFMEERPENEGLVIAGSGQRIQGQGNFQVKAASCRKLAEEAINFGSSGYDAIARNKWREIYGDFYPSEEAHSRISIVLQSNPA